MSKLLGGKNKHAQAMAAAQQQFAQVHGQWQQHVMAVQQGHAQVLGDHQRQEQNRQAKLAMAEQEYRAACATRQREVDEHNADG